MLNRRELLGFTLAALWLEPAGAAPRLRRWWPRFPLPREVWVVPPARDMEEGLLLESAAGLAARAALRGGRGVPMLYEETPAQSYRLAFEAYRAAHSPHIVRLTLDEAITRLAEKGVVKGFLLARYDPSPRPLHDEGPFDESMNVATSLAASISGLVVSETLAPRVERLGLTQLRDLRGETEADCLERHQSRFSRDVLGTCDPRARHARSLMIALDAFVCSARGETYRRALARCRPDSPVLGWGCGPEDGQTIPSSRAGLYQTCTDWCHNLPLFAGESPGASPPLARLRAPMPRHWSTLDWGDGNHYAALVLSDGDNVQWEMANFARGPEGASYYDHPRRGQIPFGWGLNAPTLAQLAPRVLEDILTRASPRDGFLLFGGAGYFYPDLYGANPGKSKALALHAERLRGYMEMTGVRALAFNFWKWDSPAALDACATLAGKLPGLEGIFAFQYYPYSAGEGAIRWVRGAKGDEVPVASCSLCVWARTGRPRETTPAAVAAQINRMERLGPSIATDRCFSWVLVHAWSCFRPAEASADSQEDLLAEERGVAQDQFTPGTERGYSPALWTARRLAPHVVPVTPAEWLLRVRLRLRPRGTLAAWLAESRAAGKPGLAECERLLRAVDVGAKGDSSAARACFEKLREAWS
jgi:hypothetical protein